ncbi:MAG: hypothetical protein NT157_03690 [Candidatus Micrarchaeota archaeon]|nr:hypothetical protein [Candidatus Micrarchaeota archaeon]
MAGDKIAEEIKKIKSRNARVERDKAWETSWTRRALIVLFTYLVIVVFLIQIRDSRPFMNALVPALAYLLSTLAVGPVRNLWEKKIYKK